MDAFADGYELEHERVRTNGIFLHIVSIGPKLGTPIILLHGFPEFWYTWRRQIGALVRAGRRVVMPDQRGYGLSEKPLGIHQYSVDSLGLDIKGVVSWLGVDSIDLAGHDWGAAVAWHFAATYPGWVRRLIIFCLPHPKALSDHLKDDFRQRLKSSCMLFFRIPLIPEILLGMRRHALLKYVLLRNSRAGTFKPAEIAEYDKAWSVPGSLKAAVNWYRAAFLSGNRDPRPLQIPTLVVWGERDPFFVPELAAETLRHAPLIHLFTVKGCTHWPHLESPFEVNAKLIDFLSE